MFRVNINVRIDLSQSLDQIITGYSFPERISAEPSRGAEYWGPWKHGHTTKEMGRGAVDPPSRMNPNPQLVMRQVPVTSEVILMTRLLSNSFVAKLTFQPIVPLIPSGEASEGAAGTRNTCGFIASLLKPVIP